MAEFICCYCGYKTTTPSGSSGLSCPNNPTKKHEWINADGVKQFVCSYCGYKTTTPRGSMGLSCSKAPHKKHKWIAG